ATHQRGGNRDRYAAAVVAHQLPLAELMPGHFPGGQPSEEIGGVAKSCRQIGVAQTHREQLVPRVADDVAELVVDPQVAQVERDERDPHGGLVERGAEHLLAFAQRLLDAPALGDIARRGGRPFRFSLCWARLTAHPCLPQAAGQTLSYCPILRIARRANRPGSNALSSVPSIGIGSPSSSLASTSAARAAHRRPLEPYARAP